MTRLRIGKMLVELSDTDLFQLYMCDDNEIELDDAKVLISSEDYSELTEFERMTMARLFERK